MKKSRNEAWSLLNQYTENPNLIKHALAVEAAMRAYSHRFGEDPELWGMTGLLHDFDYEKFPEEHPLPGKAILEKEGYPPELIHAIQAHAEATGVARESLLDRTLFAVDELTGFIVAATLVRPGKDIRDLPVKSVKKRMKDKAFARAVSRADLREGAESLGLGLEEHISFVIEAMSEVADQLELDGKD